MPQSTDLVTVTQKRFRCRHVHAAGHQCGSPALRHEEFCYFHHTTRRPMPRTGKYKYLDAAEPFALPIVEDHASALSVAAQILCRIASNDLDPARAGTMLYNLQILSTLISRASQAASADPTPPSTPQPTVPELVDDETHGPIAPITELPPDPQAEPGLVSEQPDIMSEQPGLVSEPPSPAQEAVLPAELARWSGESNDPEVLEPASNAGTIPPQPPATSNEERPPKS